MRPPAVGVDLHAQLEGIESLRQPDEIRHATFFVRFERLEKSVCDPAVRRERQRLLDVLCSVVFGDRAERAFWIVRPVWVLRRGGVEFRLSARHSFIPSLVIPDTVARSLRSASLLARGEKAMTGQPRRSAEAGLVCAATSAGTTRKRTSENEGER